MRKAVSPPLHPFPLAPLEIVRFGHVTLLTGRWILRLFKTPGCADLIGITPFNKKTYPSHHSNTLSNTKIFIDQTHPSHTSNSLSNTEIFIDQTYPSHHSNTLSNTKIFIDQTLFFPHLQLRTLNSSKRKDRTPRVRFHLSG